MKLDLNELKNYPELLSKEQVRIVGHMSKRTALYLIQSKSANKKSRGFSE